MAELKTKEDEASVEAFLAGIEDEGKRADAQRIATLLGEATGETPKMWGAAIVGYGHRHLVYDSGREIDWFLIGFSPRKANLSLYMPGGFERLQPFLQKLGKHKTGEGCLYIKRLADVDEEALREMIASALETVVRP